MDFFKQANAINLQQYYYYYQLSSFLAQQYQEMNYQNKVSINSYPQNQCFPNHFQSQQLQQQRYSNSIDPFQILLNPYNQSNPYLQIPQINIGNTIHQVNYNINHENESIATSQQQQQQHLQQVTVNHNENDDLNQAVENNSLKKTASPKKKQLSSVALKETKEKKEKNEKQFLKRKKKRTKDTNDDNTEFQKKKIIKNEIPSESYSPSINKEKESEPIQVQPLLLANNSSYSNEQCLNNNKIELQIKEKAVYNNTSNNNPNNSSFSNSIKMGLEVKGVLTRTNLAKLNDRNPFDQSYSKSIEQYWNDSFFDIVNNKKSTKKNRENNYIKTTSPDNYMDLNFYKKCKDQKAVVNRVVCDWIPQNDIKDLYKSEDDAKYITVMWKQTEFDKKNPGKTINEVIAIIKNKWPNKYINYWEDHSLYFIALCGYNIDITINEIEEYEKKSLFKSFTDKIRRESRIENKV